MYPYPGSTYNLHVALSDDIKCTKRKQGVDRCFLPFWHIEGWARLVGSVIGRIKPSQITKHMQYYSNCYSHNSLVSAFSFDAKFMYQASSSLTQVPQVMSYSDPMYLIIITTSKLVCFLRCNCTCTFVFFFLPPFFFPFPIRTRMQVHKNLINRGN